jgi:hypothetical protein
MDGVPTPARVPRPEREALAGAAHALTLFDQALATRAADDGMQDLRGKQE